MKYKYAKLNLASVFVTLLTITSHNHFCLLFQAKTKLELADYCRLLYSLI